MRSSAPHRLRRAPLLSHIRHQRRPLSTSVDTEPLETNSTERTGEITDSKKVAATPPKPMRRRPLPTSPLMDPAFHAAREKWRKQKPRASTERTEFQRKLDRNPYALALASPVRQCSITQARLPSWFLQDFSIMGHPETGDPWMVPASLSKRYFVSREQKEKEPKLSKKELRDTRRKGSNGWVARNYNMIDIFRGRTDSLNPKIYLARRSMAQHKEWQLMDPHWRDDMADHVLELLRLRAMEGLTYLASPERDYFVPCLGGYEEAKAFTDAAAVLWLPTADKQPQAQERHVEEEAVEETSSKRRRREPTALGYFDAIDGVAETAGGPQLFATLDTDRIVGSKIPVYNLAALLGPDYVDQIQSDSPQLFKNELVLVKERRMTTYFLLRLWQISNYICSYTVPRQNPGAMIAKPRRVFKNAWLPKPDGDGGL